MIDAGLLKKSFGSERFYQSVSRAFRGPDGNAFAVGTIRNQVGVSDSAKLNDCKQIIKEMMNELEHKIKIKARKQGAGVMI